MRFHWAYLLPALLLGAVHAQTPNKPAASPRSIFGLGQAVPPEAEIEVDTPADLLEETLSSMDLRQRVTQLMLVPTSGLRTPNLEDLTFLKHFTPGGVVIPKLISPNYAAAYVAQLRQVERTTGIPLLVGANLHEIGRRERGMQSEFPAFPSLLCAAAAPDAETAETLSRMLAGHMRAMDFNFYLGPRLELAPTLSKANIKLHHLGSDPIFSAEIGTAMLKKFQEYQVLPIPMGFPGGGANRVGKTPAVLLTPRGQLMSRELLPFVRAIEAGAAILHVGNTLVPMLEEVPRPASLSKAVMTDLLRGELGYEGVIVAGPVDHADIRTSYDPAEAAIEALVNGADMIYWGQSAHPVMRATEKILDAVQAERLPETVIHQAVERVLRMKQALNSHTEASATKKELSKLLNGKQVTNDIYHMERRGVTLVLNRGQVLPLREASSMPLGVTGVLGVELLQKALEEYMKPISMQVVPTARHLGEIQDFEIDRITRYTKGMRTVVCVFTDAMRRNSSRTMIRALKETGARVVAVLLGSPTQLPLLTEADAIVLSFCDVGAYEQALLAVADILAGAAPVSILPIENDLEARVGESLFFDAHEVLRSPTGRLPVTISERFHAGLSVTYEPTEAIKSLVWDFGDGRRAKDTRVEHTYRDPGRYPATLTITDSFKKETTQTFQVVVRD